MPGRDRSGPEGGGPRSGRGLGPCGSGGSAKGQPGGMRGLRRRRASVRGEFALDRTEIEDLKSERERLRERLAMVEERIKAEE